MLIYQKPVNLIIASVVTWLYYYKPIGSFQGLQQGLGIAHMHSGNIVSADSRHYFLSTIKIAELTSISLVPLEIFSMSVLKLVKPIMSLLPKLIQAVHDSNSYILNT